MACSRDFARFLLMAAAAPLVACGPDPADDPDDTGPPGGALTVDPGDFGGSTAPPVDAGKVDSGTTTPPDSGGAELRCTGSATPCTLLTSSQCLTALGCYSDGSCSGYAGSCSAKHSSYGCNALEGCYWLYSSDECRGSAWPCSMFSSSSPCTSQGSCHWSDDCGGVPLECVGLSVALCESQPGCILKEGGL
jgi:hypothetical protein